jgi:hypothetical protein
LAAAVEECENLPLTSASLEDLKHQVTTFQSFPDFVNSGVRDEVAVCVFVGEDAQEESRNSSTN